MADEPVVAFDLGPQSGERGGQLLAAGGVVPERRISNTWFFFMYVYFVQRIA